MFKRIFAVGIRRRDAVGVRAGEVVDEVDRPEIGRRERVLHDGVGAVREDAGVADVDAGLAAELGAEAHGVRDRTGPALVDEVGLVEDVVAVGGVLIGAEIDRGVGGLTAPASGPPVG